MTDLTQNNTLQDYLAQAHQAIADFDPDDGLSLSAQLHQGTGLPEGDDFLEITGRARSEDGVHAFSYRARRADLEDRGNSWFTRRALRSLNDLFRASHLPRFQGTEAEFQFLTAQEEWTPETQEL